MEPITTIGTILGTDAQRDAVHFAIAPVVAAKTLQPAQRVALKSDGTATSHTKSHIGIVDPFLSVPVLRGERFWMFLNPGSITSLRHEWKHPSFAQDGRAHVPAGASSEEARLREIADGLGIDYIEMMGGADDWVSTRATGDWGGEYLVQRGSENWRNEFPRYIDEFWRLYEVVRGKPVPDEHKQSFFSCSC